MYKRDGTIFADLNAVHWIYKIRDEYILATALHEKFTTAHHGYAVILEELDELWNEIKQKNPDKLKLQQEALQVAAMALRFLVDITEV